MQRTKTIKIRVSDAEHERLLALSEKARLAEWMRETCLATKRQARSFPKAVDPALLRQIAGIGNNLNQLAKAVNQGDVKAGDAVTILAALSSIEHQLAKLREEHQ